MCGSSRRRPITSPPGGGTLARPRRASSGPASRNDARIRLAELARRSRASRARRVHAHLVRRRSTRRRRRGCCEQLDHRLDVADPRHVRQRHRLVGEQAGGEDRQHAVLVPGGADAARERMAALDHERLGDDGPDDGGGHEGGYASRRRGTHPRAGLGDAHALHEERGAAPPRARGRGVDGVLRAALRRGRGALARGGAAARLRLRDPPHARQAPAGRRADPARGGLSGGGDRGGALARRAPLRCRATRRSRGRSSRATSSRASCTRAASSGRPGSRARAEVGARRS